jgi:hypothetical protein
VGDQDVGQQTLAGSVRRHSADGFPGGGASSEAPDVDLNALLESGFPLRGARTGVNPLREGARGADVVNPVMGQTTGVDAEPNVAGGNMDSALREMIQKMVADERANQRANERAREGEMNVEAARSMIAEELARARQQDAPTPFPRHFEEAPNRGVYSAGAGQSRGNRADNGGAGTELAIQTGRDFGTTATVGNSKFTVSLPPKFTPAESTWMLWRPQVASYFEMIGLDGILDAARGHEYTLQVNRYAIGTLQQISPAQDAAWMSTLQLKFAYQAWEQLRKAYGSRAELEMQKKLYEFECAAQRENETVREWTIRLERQVTELNVMSKEAAKDNVMGYSEQRDTAVFESTHKFRLLNVHIDNPSHEAFIATLRCQIYGMDLQDVESALITYEQGRDVQRAMSSAAGGKNTRLYQFNRNEAACFVCEGVGHTWKECKDTPTQAGFAKLKAKGIYVPRHLMPKQLSAPPTRIDPNKGRGYGGRAYLAGRGRMGYGSGRGGRGQRVNTVQFDDRNRAGTDLA